MNGLHSEFAKIAEFIEPDRIRDTLAEMVDIASPTGRELGMAQFLSRAHAPHRPRDRTAVCR